ncbi:MAG: hypothetical protein LBM93_07970 [Oscillospiraceae bacterium]|jgi:hypothetical protein|nr:hypothetical protein [Oscillospiraceae bacterium]
MEIYEGYEDYKYTVSVLTLYGSEIYSMPYCKKPEVKLSEVSPTFFEVKIPYIAVEALENEEYNGENLEREDTVTGYGLTVIVEERIADDEDFYDIEIEINEE